MNYRILSLRALPALFVSAQFVPHLVFAQLNTDDRWIVRDFFNYVYPFGSDADMGWTGTYDGNNSTAGTLSPEWQEATRMRINFYRHMAGMTPNIEFDPTKSAASQESALILGDTKILNHDPLKPDPLNPLPQDSVFWTAAGREAAQKGNIAIGSIGIHAVDGFMVDSGQIVEAKEDPEPDIVSNDAVGHRRWFLYPQADIMGSGDVPGNGFTLNDFWAANTIWVQPENPFSERPATRDGYVAWPPKGYVPANLVWPRWSLSYPGADFSSATVTMTGPDGNIPLFIEYYTEVLNSAPEPTIVWVPNSMDRTTADTWPLTGTDEAIQVTVSGATLQGQPIGPFSYTVNIFDPLDAGQQETQTTLQAPASVVTQEINAFLVVTSRSWKEGVQGRTFMTEAVNTPFDAESGLGKLVPQTAGDYDTIVSGHFGNSTNIYRLAQTNLDPQLLTFQNPFLVGTSNPSLSFISNLNGSTPIQAASVEINLGDGPGWITLWSAIGDGVYDPAFDPVPIDLSEYSNRTIRIRFKFELLDFGSYSAGQTPNNGWAFDDIVLTDVAEVVNENILPVETSQDAITVTFPDTTPTYIQAREIAFSEMKAGGFAFDWGPALLVTPGAGAFSLAGTPLNAWTKHPTVGWVYGASTDWVYSYHMGWLYVPEGAWLYSGIGWMKYISGTLDDGLWLYDPDEGFIYVQSDYPLNFLRNPFTGEPGTWGTFNP